MTWPGIEPQSPEPLANTLAINVISRTLVGGDLPLCRDAVGVFCSPSQLGQLLLFITLIESDILIMFVNMNKLYSYKGIRPSPTPKRKRGCLGYGTKLHLMVRLLFWKSGEFWVSFIAVTCMSTQIQTDSQGKVPSFSQIDLFKNFLFNWTMCKKKKLR